MPRPETRAERPKGPRAFSNPRGWRRPSTPESVFLGKKKQATSQFALRCTPAPARLPRPFARSLKARRSCLRVRPPARRRGLVPRNLHFYQGLLKDRLQWARSRTFFTIHNMLKLFEPLFAPALHPVLLQSLRLQIIQPRIRPLSKRSTRTAAMMIEPIAVPCQ